MNLKESLNQLKFDSRMVDLNIQNKVISKEDYQNHLNQLSDFSDSCEKIQIEGDEDHQVAVEAPVVEPTTNGSFNF